ncbi:hypothetical protein C8R45DRAFT_1082944 [Mycena sanguinolenta]|nr:hypothetical protein C8R45DRAFT_1082944 [Mycena sanguinolenta]
MKLLSPRVLAYLHGYRLGYSPQRLVLTCVNIPLSAYEVVQELTYFPNATLAELPMISFAPQTWSLGDTFRLNNSIFQFTVASAFDPVDDMEPVNSFSYSNVAFSENCDVAYITCNLPTRVGLAATLPDLGFASSFEFDAGILGQVNDYALDLQVALYVDILGGPAEVPYGDASITITARPCCNCSSENSEDFLEAEAQALVQQPCSSQPSRFVASYGTLINTTASIYPWGVKIIPTDDNPTDLFDGLPVKEYLGPAPLSILDNPFRNMFQVYYHLLRRDLGVLLDNQIYSSPDMYNRSITLINPGVGMEDTPFGTIGTSAAHTYHALLTNDTLMEEWATSVQVFHETNRVPVLEYLRPTPRRKSLGSAITSVFSATFAMVATVWALFSMIATALVRSRDRALRDTGWEASTDPTLGLCKSKWIFKEIGSSEEVSLTTAHEEQISNDVLEQIAALRREIYSIRGLLQRKGLSEPE